MRSVKFPAVMMTAIIASCALCISLVSVPAQRAAPVVEAADAAAPDFGPNVLIFDPTTPDIQDKVSAICKKMQGAQFSSDRYALLFKPGNYNLDIPVGFYTEVAGLGQSPDDVSITGEVHATAAWMGGNATCNFWRAVENLSQTPIHKGQAIWAVSQATAMRRVHVKGSLGLSEGGWSSGGFLADSKIDDRTWSGSQQQWLSRNCEWAKWDGGNWNMVFVGCTNPPQGAFPGKPYTVVEKTPEIAEKPYLYITSSGAYAVMVPALRKDTQGITWGNGVPTDGKSIPIGQFYLAHAGTDTAQSMNAALASGKDLILTPGTYQLDDAIKVTRPNTLVMGMGMATLRPVKGTPAILVSDVDGVKLAAILLEASQENSPSLLQIGEPGSKTSHAADPICLWDVHARAGGAVNGRCTDMIVINSNNVIGDNSWLWRADHGAGAGWDSNVVDSSLVVNGNDVTFYGLFCEHGEKYQTLWNGNGGRTYFYQSEYPYDVPNQAAWSHNGENGYASYKVADSVTTHEAWGLGVYAFIHGGEVSENAIEAPKAPGVQFHDMVTFNAGGTSSHIFDGQGDSGKGSKRLKD